MWPKSHLTLNFLKKNKPYSLSLPGICSVWFVGIFYFSSFLSNGPLVICGAIAVTHRQSSRALRPCCVHTLWFCKATVSWWCVPCLTRAAFTVLSVSSVLSGFFCGYRSVSPHHRAVCYMLPHDRNALECENLKNASTRHINKSWYAHCFKWPCTCMSHMGSWIGGKTDGFHSLCNKVSAIKFSLNLLRTRLLSN